MKYFRIVFKNKPSVTVKGNTLSQAVISAGIKPFLVIDVESITQIN
jgi:hypothetical protein